MTVGSFKAGDQVTAFYKTGKYIGEITDASRPQSYLVRVLAVEKHPMQGDLHNPKEADVLMFHQRKALAFREQTNVPKNMVKPYSGDIPSYGQSLQEAVARAIQELEGKEDRWSKKSLESLRELEKEYSANQ
ncbi:kinase-associated protein B [Peribacillus deserti]|uniref:Kinase-associated protein B n=1 Tax=Peribacillus deserti TaxID=673318 RepID=A0ABS2QML2_9BACI|nr:kinase-associated protein B [Peribacillus deserti]